MRAKNRDTWMSFVVWATDDDPDRARAARGATGTVRD
jgi:hypothetical protein